MSAKEYSSVEKVPTLLWAIFVPIFLVGGAIALVRFFVGLGFTGMNDGYPWGIWIAYDVLVGTAFGTGGFTMAILIYLFNKWKYHPLIRSAIITSAFGYTLAGVSVIIDLGRWWNFYSLLLPWRWNHTSVLLEVALCIMGYTLILWLEIFPAIYEKREELAILKPFKGIIKAIYEGFLGKPLVYVLVVAVGILLPNMHQSSLGTMLVISPTKVHPLWHTAWMPLLFLLSVYIMGYSMVAVESLASSYMLRREYETHLLKTLAPLPMTLAIIWIALRFLSLITKGSIGLAFKGDFYSLMFWIEILLMVLGIIFLAMRKTPRNIFIGSIFFVFHGALYRFNTYLVVFDPSGKLPYMYVPSFGEVFITLGIISLEVLLYLLFIRYLNILPTMHKAKS